MILSFCLPLALPCVRLSASVAIRPAGHASPRLAIFAFDGLLPCIFALPSESTCHFMPHLAFHGVALPCVRLSAPFAPLASLGLFCL